jgi:hypothetical protein
MRAQLVADVTFYPADQGGKTVAALPGWGCPCCPTKDIPVVGYDGLPLLGDTPIAPGEQRRLGFVFPSGNEAVIALRSAGRFYLWEGRFIGEATVL